MKGFEGKWKFYLGYLIEVSDTGGVKLMTRNRFMASTECYKVRLSYSTLNEIFKLVDDTIIFTQPTKREESGCVYDGPTYTLLVKTDSNSRIVTYIPCLGNSPQKSLRIIMEGVREKPVVIEKTNIPLNEYKDIIYKNALKFSEPLPMIGKKLIFTKLPRR
jgi:hypothetical protein